MADGSSESVESVAVSGGAAKWLASRAAESNLEPEEFLTRLVAAFRTIEESGEVSFAAESDLNAVRQELESLRSETGEDVADVRERVREVADALDGKASVEHDHPELGERVEEVADAVGRVETETRAVAEEVEEVREWAEEGFENYEDVLEYLRDATDDLDEKVGTLARVLVEVRQSTRALAAAEEDRAAAAALKHMANEQGVREAACEECENAVDVALLTDGTCPFCGSTFSAVESSRRFGVFQSATLTTGERPALEAPEIDESVDDDLEELVEND